MKQLFILLFLVTSLAASSQTPQISNTTIWSALYPNNNNFDNENRLIRKVTREGAQKELRTTIAKTFYYTSGQQQKAAVVLFSYDLTDGEAPDCHLCYPEMDVATFQLSGGNWSKVNFVQNWKEATGSWGAGPKLEQKKYNNVNCLVLSYGYGSQGEFHNYTSYFNIETLKEVKTITD